MRPEPTLIAIQKPIMSRVYPKQHSREQSFKPIALRILNLVP
jgi:hypothetical protein